MIKIVSSKQNKEADNYTILHEPVSSVQLMERASNAFVQQFKNDFPNKKIPVAIFCGSGNNGGDGLAIARILLKANYDVHVYHIVSTKTSGDFSKNLKRLQLNFKKKFSVINDVQSIDKIPIHAIVIDALFGTGLNKPIKKESVYGQIIEKINSRNFINCVAVDIPSGLFSDQPTTGMCILANKTYTFQFPKLAFFLPDSGKHVGDLIVLDIQLHPDFTAKIKSAYYFTTQEDIKNKLKVRKKFSHKGTYGHALIVAGSYGKAGAAALASKACLRSGAGLVTAYVPSDCTTIIQSSIPEVMCESDKNQYFISEFPQDKKYSAIVIGPGVGTDAITLKGLEVFLKKNKSPLVIDADGLNLLAKHKKLLNWIPENSILTPHPKEFERLAGNWSNDFVRLELQQEFSIKHKVILVLKGAHTSISNTDGTVFFNSTGNAGMATAGSGDVLTGIIAGLMAQDYSSIDSAVIGVYIHGLSGDIALQTQSKESLIASDIISHLGKAFTSVHLDA